MASLDLAALFQSDSKEEEFLGFDQAEISRINRNLLDNESDISVSTVNTEDLSDIDSTNSEIEEEDEQWNTNPAPVQVNAFVENTGPVTDATGFSAFDFFKLLFREENFDRIAEETNHYARQLNATTEDPNWCETNAIEIRAFLGVNILFGIKQLPEIHLYWSKNLLLGVPEIQKIFSRNRFTKISQYLHLNDKSGELPTMTNYSKCDPLLILLFLR